MRANIASLLTFTRSGEACIDAVLNRTASRLACTWRVLTHITSARCRIDSGRARTDTGRLRTRSARPRRASMRGRTAVGLACRAWGISTRLGYILQKVGARLHRRGAISHLVAVEAWRMRSPQHPGQPDDARVALVVQHLVARAPSDAATSSRSCEGTTSVAPIRRVTRTVAAVRVVDASTLGNQATRVSVAAL
jgi:hypothetical protein